MRTFIPHALDPAVLSAELDALEALLAAKTHLKERAEIAPFFKGRPHLRTALSLMNAAVEAPNRFAHELDMFGDFVCDVASGDSEANAYTLVEFEDAREHSVFTRLEPGKTMRRWSPRFEQGFSQLVDWAWRLSTGQLVRGVPADLRQQSRHDSSAAHRWTRRRPEQGRL